MKERSPDRFPKRHFYYNKNRFAKNTIATKASPHWARLICLAYGANTTDASMKRCGTHQSRCLWCTSTVRVLVSHPPGGRQSCVYTQMNKVRLSRRPIVRVATVYMIETMNIRILVKVYTGENAQARNAGLCARCIRTPPEAPSGAKYW